MLTELRVHGVTGMPAEQMLDRPLVHQVAGDGGAGFFRPRPDYGNTTDASGAELEAYRWGNLTSGAASRALWLLLLPLMLANVSMWLRPPAGRTGAFLVRTLCRIFSAALTATFVLACVGVAVDLVGWQCAAPQSACASDRHYLAFLSHGFFAPPGRRLAATALAPVAAICVLWYLGATTWGRYESFLGPADPGGDRLEAGGFWRTAQLVGRLRCIHLAVAFGTLSTVLLSVLATHDRAPAGWVLFAIAVGGLAACLVVLCLPGMVERDTPPRWASVVAGGLLAVAVLLTAATLVYGMLPRAPWRSTGGLPGYATGIAVVFAAQIAMLMALGAASLLQRAPHQYLAGQAGPVIASLGLFAAAAFSSGVIFLTADVLGGSAQPAMSRPPAPLVPPAILHWAAVDVVIMAVTAVIVVGWVWLAMLPVLRRRAVPTTDADFPGGRAQDPGRAEEIDAAIAQARLTDRNAVVIAGLYVPPAAAAVVFAILSLAGIAPVQLARAGTPAERILGSITNVGTMLIGLGTVLLLVLGLVAYRYPIVRRIVGIAWDLGTFWPRTAHPLAPPCYAMRAVPELAVRASWLSTSDGGCGVILSAHSQGSVLVAAAVLQMPRSVLPGVALVSYGCPLQRLYARLFPAYVDDALLAAVSAAVDHRWTNLWRDTDPIGGVIGAPAEDQRFRDPQSFPIPPGDTAYPPVHAHLWYERDPAYDPIVTELAGRLTRDPAPSLPHQNGGGARYGPVRRATYLRHRHPRYRAG